MDHRNYRVWYVEHGKNGVFTQYSKVPEYFEENITLSENYVMMYNINKSTPNPYLFKFGYIVQNIPGDAVVLYEDGESIKDIPLDFEEKFPEILKHDMVARSAFASEWESAGAIVMRF